MRFIASTLLGLFVLLSSSACSDMAGKDGPFAAAPSDSPAPGRIVQSSCRQGECSWLRVVSVETAEKAPQGELRRIVARRGTSLHLNGKLPTRASDARIEWQAQDGVEYAFCSKERPAYAFTSGGPGMIVHFLDLFDLAGYQYASASLYTQFCHGLDDLPDAKVLTALGYRPRTRSEQVEAAGPEVMTRF